MKKLFLILTTLVVGCASTGPINPNSPVPMPDVATINSANLADFAITAENHYRKFHSVEGILWQGGRTDPSVKDPDLYGSGGDSLLFTGFYLAAASFRYNVTKDPADLDKVIETLRGLHILTNAMGIPGNLARCALPVDRADKFLYPPAWQGRIDIGFVYTGSLEQVDPFTNGRYPQFVYYTRVSRDQLSGLNFGLSTFWKILNPKTDPTLQGNVKLLKARAIAGDMVQSIWTRLSNTDFEIKDQTGRNDTADEVDGLLKLQLHGLYRAVTSEQFPMFAAIVKDEYDEAFESLFGVFGDPASWFYSFNNIQQYYAWNLRFSRTYSLWLLDEDSKHQAVIREYVADRMFKHVADHQNVHFNFIYNAMRLEDPVRLDEAVFSLKSRTFMPFRNYNSPIALEDPPSTNFKTLGKILTGIPRWMGFVGTVPIHLREPTTYFKWQEDPWSVGYVGGYPSQENSGLDFLLPYWMGRYYRFIKQNQ